MAAGCLALLGALLLFPPFDEVLSRWSYDWGLRLRSPVELEKCPVVIVYMDDESHAQLGQSGITAWDRRLHAQLIRTLKERGAAAIAFDVLFRPPYADTNGTRALLAAAEPPGPVFFAATGARSAVPTGQMGVWRVVPPEFGVPADVTFGLVEESKQERTVREHETPLNNVEPLSWLLARAVLQDPPVPATRRRWINFYGPEGSIPHVSYAAVLSNTVSRSISFTNSVVFVGSGVKVPFTKGAETDDFKTPYSERFPGVAVNATVFLNLYYGNWLTRIPSFAELAMVLLVGIGVGVLFSRLPPLWTIPLALVGSALVLFGAQWLLTHTHVWFSWLIPVCIQIPGGLVGTALAANLRLIKEKRVLTERLQHRLGSESAPVPTPALGSASAPAQPSAASAAAAGNRVEEDRTLVTPQNPFTIPNYSLIRRIGKGAYGEVWIAKNAVGLLHAVKIIHRHAFEMPEPFEREFRGVQSYMPISLGHAGLVPVLYVGRDVQFDCFYYMMELADDVEKGIEVDVTRYAPRSLDQDLAKVKSLPVKQCVQIGLRLAETLSYLHSQKLVHRDIKPSNVIFVRGLPKFADLGLVTRSQDDRRAGAEATATYVGTKGYIPPEGSGTPGADVYALGKVLYQMAWGKEEDKFPALATDLHGRAEREELMLLNPIILKACEPNSIYRYANADDLLQALRELERKLGR